MASCAALKEPILQKPYEMRNAFKKTIRADVQTRPGHKKPRSQRCSPAKKCETETICIKLRVFMGFRSFPFVMQIREMILREKMLNLESRSRLERRQTSKLAGNRSARTTNDYCIKSLRD